MNGDIFRRFNAIRESRDILMSSNRHRQSSGREIIDIIQKSIRIFQKCNGITSKVP